MLVLRESRIVVGERERESGQVRATMAFPDLLENTWLRRDVKGYIAACTARGDAGRGLLTRTDWRTRAYIAPYENHTNFRMLHSNADHYARKGPRGGLAI